MRLAQQSERLRWLPGQTGQDISVPKWLLWMTITAISLLWHWLPLSNACVVPGTLGISQPFLHSITAISQKWYFQNLIAKEMLLERE